MALLHLGPLWVVLTSETASLRFGTKLGLSSCAMHTHRNVPTHTHFHIQIHCAVTYIDSHRYTQACI